MVAIFFKHFDLLEPYDSPIFSDFSEFGVGRSSCVLSFFINLLTHLCFSEDPLLILDFNHFFYTSPKQHSLKFLLISV